MALQNVVGTAFKVVCLFIISSVSSSIAPFSDSFTFMDEYPLPGLPFDYDDLEPYLDAATVRVHHTAHHQAYTTNMNKALTAWRQESEDFLSKQPIVTILENLEKVPEKYRTQIRNHGGGYSNHAIFWSVMNRNPNRSPRLPTGKLLEDIIDAFGKYEVFVEEFSNKAKTLFGSGYAWLCRNKEGQLIITTTANQDSPVSSGLHPLLTIDMWEHAYYLQHQYRRPDYIHNWWAVVDWSAVVQLDHQWAVRSHEEL